MAHILRAQTLKFRNPPKLVPLPSAPSLELPRLAGSVICHAIILLSVRSDFVASLATSELGLPFLVPVLLGFVRLSFSELC